MWDSTRASFTSAYRFGMVACFPVVWQSIVPVPISVDVLLSEHCTLPGSVKWTVELFELNWIVKKELQCVDEVIILSSPKYLKTNIVIYFFKDEN